MNFPEIWAGFSAQAARELHYGVEYLLLFRGTSVSKLLRQSVQLLRAGQEKCFDFYRHLKNSFETKNFAFIDTLGTLIFAFSLIRMFPQTIQLRHK